MRNSIQNKNIEMKVLVLNCGSSSIKYQVIDICAGEHQLLAKGLVERIGLEVGDLTHKPVGKEVLKRHEPIPDHTAGIRMVLEALTDARHGVLGSLDEIRAVGHRVAHGGEFFKESCLVTEDVKTKIRSLFAIAPLHNPANLEGILSIEKVLPSVPQVAVFDTSFHQTIKPENYLYAIPYEYYEKYGVRRYGFHGTSHKYVARVGAELAGLSLRFSRIITCHIGNGASITAIRNGKSVCTSMGFTPVDGLVMGTRCGDVDPSALLFIAGKEHMSASDVEEMINKRSGVMGVSGVSSDMRDIDAAYEAGNQRAILARDMYYTRVREYVGKYAALMGGVDLIIFTGGVGENSPELREAVCSRMEFMGVAFDRKKNLSVRGTDAIISRRKTKVKVAVVATDEELVIATDTFNIVNK